MESVSDRISLRGIGVALTNLTLAVLFLAFAYANALSFLVHPRLSVLMIVITETIVGIFLLIRHDPDQTRHTWKTWITTTGGTLMPLLLRPTEAPADLFIGQAIQITGFVMQTEPEFRSPTGAQGN
jgi:hypothetical protein